MPVSSEGVAACCCHEWCIQHGDIDIAARSYRLQVHLILPPTKKPLNLSIQGLFDIAVWLHDLDSNQGPSD